MSAARRSSTPYARRLARERGLALDGLAGSGPQGRIVAADVLAFAGPPKLLAPSAVADAPVATAAVPAPAPRSIGAFQAGLDLAPLAAVIAASGSGLAVAPFLLKAAARAAGAEGERLILRDAAGREALVEGAAWLSPGAIARRLEEGIAGDAPFVVDWLEGAGIRPLASGLPPSAVLKLVVVADAGRADLLLVHDEAEVTAAVAVAMLAAIRDLAEAPLRLLV